MGTSSPKPWQDPLEIDDFSKLSMPARALFLIGPDGGLHGVLALSLRELVAAITSSCFASSG